MHVKIFVKNIHVFKEIQQILTVITGHALNSLLFEGPSKLGGVKIVFFIDACKRSLLLFCRRQTYQNI